MINCLKFFNDVLEVEVENEDIVRTVRLGERTEDVMSGPLLLIHFKDRMQSLYKIMKSKYGTIS